MKILQSTCVTHRTCQVNIADGDGETDNGNNIRQINCKTVYA